jgi:hypothetical protein
VSRPVAARGAGAVVGAGAALAFALGCAPSIDRGAPEIASPAARADAGPRASAEAAPATGPEGYVYVARSTRVSVGLAEARGLTPEEARSVVDRLAGAFEACAARLGPLAPGAARLVVLLDERGRVTGSDAKLAPGSETARAGLLCLISPARGLSYPPLSAAAGPASKRSTRGFAVEAAWESSGPGPEAPRDDAGATP